MTPWDLVVWALAASAAILVDGLALVLVIAAAREMAASKPEPTSHQIIPRSQHL